MRRGSMLAGLRPRDDESETELDEEAPESEAPKPPKTRAQPSQKGVPKPSPAETRALDLQIFSAADILEVSLGRTPTRAEIAAKAKVPGPTDGARRQRVSVALRRRGLLTPSTAIRSAAKVQPARIAPKAAPAPVSTSARAQADQAAPGVLAVEALRDRLRGQLAAVEVTLAALRGES